MAMYFDINAKSLSEAALEEHLWDDKGEVRRWVLEVMSGVAPAGFEADWVADMLDMIEHFQAAGAKRSEIVARLVYEMTTEDGNAPIPPATVSVDVQYPFPRAPLPDDASHNQPAAHSISVSEPRHVAVQETSKISEAQEWRGWMEKFIEARVRSLPSDRDLLTSGPQPINEATLVAFDDGQSLNWDRISQLLQEREGLSFYYDALSSASRDIVGGYLVKRSATTTPASLVSRQVKPSDRYLYRGVNKIGSSTACACWLLGNAMETVAVLRLIGDLNRKARYYIYESVGFAKDRR